MIMKSSVPTRPSLRKETMTDRPAVKNATCLYCGDEFMAEKKSIGYKEYCFDCAKSKVWFRKDANEKRRKYDN